MMQKRICAFIVLSVIMASVFLCSLSQGGSGSCDGLFYRVSAKSSKMSDVQTENTSLGAVSLPGHRITEDYRQEVFLKGQHLNLKCITMLFVILTICSCIWFNSYSRAGIIKKVKFRLLI